MMCCCAPYPMTSVEDDSPVGGGRATREPTVDRTALAAEVDSVVVAAKAAESVWQGPRTLHSSTQLPVSFSAAQLEHLSVL